jgi:hypothetical protein
MAYTLAQLESIWKQAAAGTKYDSSAWATLMAAIALAESSGNPEAVNATDNGGTQSSYGLWQISTGTHTPPASNWNDPTVNAHLAIGKLNSQGLGAWGTYTSGAYRQYLGGASAASLPQTAGSPTGTVQAETSGLDILNPLSVASSLTSAAKSLGDIVSFFNTILSDIEWLFVPSHWVRIFAFLFGTGAMITGTYALMQTGKGKQGDIVLALGIGLVSFGGVLLFIAFHNLPTDVKNLGGLLAWVAKGVQGGAQDVQKAEAGT